MSKKIVRAWTVYAPPSVIDRVREEVLGANARLFPNSGCSALAEEQHIETVERDVQTTDYPGGPIYTKSSKSTRVDWVPVGQTVGFMPLLSNDPAIVYVVGYWDEIYKEAGDKLIAFLKKRPIP
jgi:hypothetical protein